ncbi:adenine phosphoribosyltransferase-like isoform X1 [Actinia tenebrosa]|uniref:Adenine phosphoribosyltransferase n=1 Tax=Actinia tenebrosa TaxID=6105 RepID=A0A6P8H6U0_ACTTE|nr:adenine phosphoribosyltransferase-like isoform X1 [Actinia tenebrosa]
MASQGNISDQDKAMEHVKGLIRCFQDFPKPGISFKDICPILKDPCTLKTVTDVTSDHIRKNVGQIDAIIGLEARGFLFGPQIAMNLGIAFIPIRKSGKLPGPTIKVSYSKEYGEDVFEMQEDALKPGQKVVVFDDLIATGGTLVAACDLVKSAGCEVKQCIALLELEELNGKAKLSVPCHVLIKL